MVCIDKTIHSEMEAAAFVRECEMDFDRRLDTAIQSIIQNKDIHCITLSGPSCAGKTTAAHKLIDEIEASGRTAKIISIDDFFHERSELKITEETIDYDTVAAIDLEYFAACVGDMMSGRRTMLPRFDFLTGKRSGTAEYVVSKKDVLIFEGIQAVYPEITALLAPYAYKCIFVNVTQDATVNGVYFPKNDIRLARRIVRDSKFRAATPEFTLHIWGNVRDNEEKSIFPHVDREAYLLDSFQPYEPFMIGQFVLPLLQTVPESSPYYPQARHLYDKFHAIRGNEISPDHLSEDSLYHEFLG